MFCTACGISLTSADRFCTRCGRSTDPQAAVPPPRRLCRLARDKKVGGVCSGFARYMDVDVTLMRLVWLLGSILTGIGFIAYLVLWMAMPLDENMAGTPAVQAR